MGEWERKTTTWWVYGLPDGRGRRLPFGQVRCRPLAGAHEAQWEAIVIGEGVGEDVTLRRCVSFAVAAEAIEQAAATLAGAPWERDRAA